MNDNGIILGMDEADYHSRRELSSTEARMILRTPAEYRWHKDHPPLVAPSKKFDVGSAIHAKVLGTGYEVDVIPDDILASNGAVSTAAAKAFVAESRAAGRIPMKLADFEAIDGPAEAVLAHPGARQLLTQPGNAEASVFATDPGTNVEVRARFDFLPNLSDGLRVAVDLKSTRDASKRAFETAVARYEYPIQRSWYLDALRFVTGEAAEMVFIAVEKDPPYLTAVYQLPTVWALKGHTAAAKARRLYAECVASGEWPGLPTTVQFLDEPTWHVYQFEEENPE
jgi:hypothetical protein